MADDIFDYFGGNSSRKVEPLNEDEMFDDLLPKKPESDSESEEVKGDEIVDAELVSMPGESEDVDPDAAAETSSAGGDEGVGADDDPWNDLASSLGLQPVAAAKVVQRKKPEAKKESDAKSSRKTARKPRASASAAKAAKAFAHDDNKGLSLIHI